MPGRDSVEAPGSLLLFGCGSQYQQQPSSAGREFDRLSHRVADRVGVCQYV